jgi:hypothetical protein
MSDSNLQDILVAAAKKQARDREEAQKKLAKMKEQGELCPSGRHIRGSKNCSCQSK